MQIKIFTIPIIGGEPINEEMNVFLRSKKILHMETQIVNNHNGAFWSFCIKYLDEAAATRRTKKVDYKAVLDDLSFQRFNEMRKIRKQLAQDEGIPAYAIFTDQELAGLAKLEEITLASMRSVKGIGIKKIEKYGAFFLTKKEDEKSK